MDQITEGTGGFGGDLIKLASGLVEIWEDDFKGTEKFLATGSEGDLEFFKGLVKWMMYDVYKVNATISRGEQKSCDFDQLQNEERFYLLASAEAGVEILLCISMLVFIVYICSILLSRISWVTMIIRVFIVSFFISCLWNYYLEYKKLVADRFMVKIKGLPAGCMNSGTSFFGILETFTTTLFKINSGEEESECQQFARAVIVDPVWEITPLTAFMVTLTNLLLTPIQSVAMCANKTFRILFTGIPIVFIPIFSVITVYTLTLLFIFLFKYEVKIPYLLHLNPKGEGGVETIVQKPMRRRVVCSKFKRKSIVLK